MNRYEGNLLTRVLTADREELNTTQYPRLLFGYDSQGAIDDVVYQAGLPGVDFRSHNLAKVYRNAAGFVRRRYSAYADGSTAFWNDASVQAFWYYNTQGRVTGVIGGVFDVENRTWDWKTTYSASYYDSGDTQVVRQRFNGNYHEFQYQYDNRHMLTKVLPGTGNDTYHADFDYTSGGRLAGANVNVPNTATIGYKRNVEYSYNEDDPSELGILENRERPWDFARYKYDIAGNMTERYVLNKAVHTFKYDGDNRIREVRHVSTGESEMYYYDGDTRILAIRYDANKNKISTRRWFGPTEVRYDANDIQVETIQRVSLGQTIARIRNRNEVETVVQSPRNHVMLSMEADGSVNGGGVYGPFGEILEKAGSLEDYTQGFNGKDYDTVGNLSYYGHRYYDPVGLIWNRADPLYTAIPEKNLVQPNKAHLYSFSANNPIRFYDPDGRDEYDNSGKAATTLGTVLSGVETVLGEFAGESLKSLNKKMPHLDAALKMTDVARNAHEGITPKNVVRASDGTVAMGTVAGIVLAAPQAIVFGTAYGATRTIDDATGGVLSDGGVVVIETTVETAKWIGNTSSSIHESAVDTTVEAIEGVVDGAEWIEGKLFWQWRRAYRRKVRILERYLWF